MKYRKCIGIILGAIYKDMNREQLSGILEQAYALGFSAYVFTLGDGSDDLRSQHGEENLFRLINFSLLDGIIYLPYTFTKDEYRNFLRDFLETRCPLPIVTVSNGEMHLPHVWNDERTETAEIIRHLIRCHSCRHILYLTGPQGSPVSENRVLGYRDALEEAGLPFEKSHVIYGDFWTQAAQVLAHEIASGKRIFPDAVACANDYMAISLCDSLAGLGISVPENIRITGYDGTVEAFIHDPQITTYRPPFRQMGRDAMCLLYEKITGETPVSVLPPASGVLLARTTCGCSPGIRDGSMTLFNFRRMEESYLDSDFTANLYAVETLRAFIDKAFPSPIFSWIPNTGTRKHIPCVCPRTGIRYRSPERN